MVMFSHLQAEWTFKLYLEEISKKKKYARCISEAFDYIYNYMDYMDGKNYMDSGQ